MKKNQPDQEPMKRMLRKAIANFYPSILRQRLQEFRLCLNEQEPCALKTLALTEEMSEIKQRHPGLPRARRILLLRNHAKRMGIQPEKFGTSETELCSLASPTHLIPV